MAINLQDRKTRLDYLEKCIAQFEYVIKTTSANVQVFNRSQLAAVWGNIARAAEAEGMDILAESQFFNSLLRGMDTTIGDNISRLKQKFADAKRRVVVVEVTPSGDHE